MRYGAGQSVPVALKNLNDKVRYTRQTRSVARGNPVVQHWGSRQAVLNHFTQNYHKYQDQLSAQTIQPPPSPNPPVHYRKKRIIRLGATDGGAHAQRLGSDCLVVAAGHPQHANGSGYRTGPRNTGNAQEEQLSNTWATAAALTCISGATSHISQDGEIHYSQRFSDTLRQGGAIKVNNVPNSNGSQTCNQVTVAAPDLTKEHMSMEEYGQRMYTMYKSMFAAIEQDPNSTPVILTLPGSGVFAGNDPRMREVHALALQRAMREWPNAKKRDVHLPYATKPNNAAILAIAEDDHPPQHLSPAEVARVQQSMGLTHTPKHQWRRAQTQAPRSLCRGVYQIDNRRNPYGYSDEIGLKFDNPQDAQTFLAQSKGLRGLIRPHPTNSSTLIIMQSQRRGQPGVYDDGNGSLAINTTGTGLNKEEVANMLGLTNKRNCKLQGTSIHVYKGMLRKQIKTASHTQAPYQQPPHQQPQYQQPPHQQPQYQRPPHQQAQYQRPPQRRRRPHWQGAPPTQAPLNETAHINHAEQNLYHLGAGTWIDTTEPTLKEMLQAAFTCIQYGDSEGPGKEALDALIRGNVIKPDGGFTQTFQQKCPNFCRDNQAGPAGPTLNM